MTVKERDIMPKGERKEYLNAQKEEGEPQWVMFLAENLHFHKSASIAFDWSNAEWAKPKPL